MLRKTGAFKQNNCKTDATEFPTTLRGFYWRLIKRFPFYFGSLFTLRTSRYCISMLTGSLISMWTFGLFENVANISWPGLIMTLAMIWLVHAASDILYLIESFILGYRREVVNRFRHSIMYNRLLKNDVQYFIDNPSGRMVTQMQTINSGMQSLTIAFWSEFVGVLLGFLFVAGYVFKLSVWLAIIIVGNGVLRLVWQMFVQKKISVLKKQLQEVGAAFMGARSDAFENALSVKAFANEEAENKFMLKSRLPLLALYRRDAFLDRARFLPTAIMWGIMHIAVLVICFFGIRDGTMTISEAAFVITASGAITSAFSRLNDTLRRYSENKARTEQAWDDLFVDVDIKDSKNAKKLNVSNAEIKFDKVTFAYREKNVLKNFDLDIASGEKVGVVGLSGAGKTTLVNLLLRSYDVKGGAIKIDGNDIRDVTLHSLRRNIAYVPQETALFNRTILENIKYSMPGATRAQVIAAAKKANIHDFIVGLPDGYDTMVGNRGVKLSGGQRQRIAIARAILKDAPILILDEATSALDSENEVLIQGALQKVMRGKTTVAIAHRLSTLRNMDRIIVMSKGKIVESGTHKQLLRRSGVYRKLWDMQTNGFVNE
ncbi:MAG: ABC transporter ATP-binding protein [Alphaproteobacteria bacterium]|nr:ABC transporter ATP-binding protein [Alphaproteobacteria bacterium]